MRKKLSARNLQVFAMPPFKVQARQIMKSPFLATTILTAFGLFDSCTAESGKSFPSQKVLAAEVQPKKTMRTFSSE